MGKKRILILTHQLGHNFGGILQAYALQEYLRRHGVEADTTSMHTNDEAMVVAKRYIKYFIRRIIHIFYPAIKDIPPDFESRLHVHTQVFIDKYIQTVDGRTLPLHNLAERYDALISGSDQVWRSIYVPVEKYLFDFAENQEIVRLSYAASFGRDDLSEYGPELLRSSARLAKRLDGLSVREDSGVGLVEKHWGMKAEHHVDPTLLLEKEDYIKLVEEDEGQSTSSDGNLFAYVLDREGQKGKIIDKVADELNLKDFEILPETTIYRKEFAANPEKYLLPPVSQWLRSFMEAEFIITDSFHGTAFSIIFNKPFLAVGNKERGLARFTSLLKMFGLEDRLVSDISEVTDELLKNKIDWKSVNSMRQKEKKRAHQYLARFLTFAT